MAMIDRSAMRSCTYGMYIVSSVLENRSVGCVVNTFMQVTSTPLCASIAINKENYTTKAILESGKFEVVALAESASMDFIGAFGYKSSKDIDKFASIKSAVSAQGLQYPTEHVVAHFSLKVSQTLDLGTHWYIVGEIVESQVLSEEKAMSYSYYHEVKGGKTPPRASSYDPEEENEAFEEQDSTQAIKWRCKICGYEVVADELPDDFSCPLCGAGKAYFERVELA